MLLALAALACSACAGGAAAGGETFLTRQHLVYNVLYAQGEEIREGQAAPEGEPVAEVSVRADVLTDTVAFVFSVGEAAYDRMLRSQEAVEVRCGVSSAALGAGQIAAGGESVAVSLEKGGRVVLAFEGANTEKNSGKVFQCVLCIAGETASDAGYYRVEVGSACKMEAEAASLGGGAQARGGSNGSSGGYVDFISAGGTVTFTVEASAATEAKFSVTLGLLNETFFNSLSDVYRIEVNGEEVLFEVSVPQGLGMNWQIWTHIRAGNISLRQGNNTITFTGVAPLLLDCIALQPLSGAALRAA